MKSKAQLFFRIVCLIVGYEVLEFAFSRVLHFRYSILQYGAYCLFFLAGYLGFRCQGLLCGFQAGLIAGLTEAVVELAIAVFTNSFPFRLWNRFTLLLFPVLIGLATLVGGLCGLSAAAIAKAMTQMKQDAGRK